MQIKRLAENANKMADMHIELYANENKIAELLSNSERPVHRAVSSGKVLCPKDECIQEKLFFQENGIVHHFRMKHKEDSFYTTQ